MPEQNLENKENLKTCGPLDHRKSCLGAMLACVTESHRPPVIARLKTINADKSRVVQLQSCLHFPSPYMVIRVLRAPNVPPKERGCNLESGGSFNNRVLCRENSGSLAPGKSSMGSLGGEKANRSRTVV